MKALFFPHWKGFELVPRGYLLEQFIDLSSPMGIAYERCVEFYKDFHTHDRLMLVFPRGASRMEIRVGQPRKTFRISQDSFLMVPAGMEHDDESISAIYDTLAIYPETILVRSVASHLGISTARLLTLQQDCKKFERSPWLEKLLQEYFYVRVVTKICSDEHVKFMEREIVREVLRQVFGLKPNEKPLHFENETEGVAKVIRCMEAGLFGPLPLKTICKNVGMSESDLLRKFRKATGKTPHSYIKNRRLEEAKKLLESTPHPVGDIALLVGYTNFGAFTDAFRQKYGEVPSVLRKSGNL